MKSGSWISAETKSFLDLSCICWLRISKENCAGPGVTGAAGVGAVAGAFAADGAAGAAGAACAKACVATADEPRRAADSDRKERRRRGLLAVTVGCSTLCCDRIDEKVRT